MAKKKPVTVHEIKRVVTELEELGLSVYGPSMRLNPSGRSIDVWSGHMDFDTAQILAYRKAVSKGWKVEEVEDYT